MIVRSSYWVLLCLILFGCSQPLAKPLPTDALPTLGETRTAVEQALRGREAEGVAAGVHAYELHVINQFLRVIVLYSEEHDGKARVMQVNLHSHDAISDEAAQEAKRQLLPPDTRVIRERDVSSAVRDDAQQLGAGNDMAFLYSASVGKRVSAKTYYHRGWLTGLCSSAQPGTIEEYTERQDRNLTELGFFSAYLDKCQMKV